MLTLGSLEFKPPRHVQSARPICLDSFVPVVIPIAMLPYELFALVLLACDAVAIPQGTYIV